MNATPGWYNAQGDPPGTVRWWDGAQWVGEPQTQPQAGVPGQAASPVFPAAPPMTSTSGAGEVHPDRGGLEWWKLALSRWKDFSGRSRRSEYWWFSLVNFIVSIVLYIPATIFLSTETGGGTLIGGILMAVYFVFGLVMLIPGLAAGVRRLHDTNRSGWFLLLYLIPCIGFIVLLVFFFTEGNRHANKYGIDPKGAPY